MKKFNWLKNLDYKTVTGILLGVVIIETFFLVRMQFREEKKKVTPSTKVGIEKTTKAPKPTAKIASEVPEP